MIFVTLIPLGIMVGLTALDGPPPPADRWAWDAMWLLALFLPPLGFLIEFS